MNELTENDKKIDLLQKQLKEAMINKRSENALFEKMQLGFYSKYLEQQRERFDYADTAQWLLDDKCDVDLIYFQDKICEWLKSAKNENQKKTLNEMFLSILRVSSYIDQMRTLNKHTVSKYVTAEKNLQNAYSDLKKMELEKNQEIKKLTKELENAKKEIEFIQGNNS